MWEAVAQYLSTHPSRADISACKISLFTGLSVTATGSASNVIYHANPSIDGEPWYDDVAILDDDEGGVKTYHAGRLRAFVQVLLPDEVCETFAFVHGFRAVALKPGRGKKGKGKDGGYQPNRFIFEVFEPQARWCDEVPYPYMTFLETASGKPIFWLVPTEAISFGMWVQESFDVPGNYICIRHE